MFARTKRVPLCECVSRITVAMCGLSHRYSNVIMLFYVTNPQIILPFPCGWRYGQMVFQQTHNNKFQLTDYLGKNMRKITQALSAVCLLFALNSSAVAPASSPSPLNPGTNVAKLAEQAPIHWVSVAQIENSLAGRPPMAVGFDIDDTVLFPVRVSGAAKPSHQKAKII